MDTGWVSFTTADQLSAAAADFSRCDTGDVDIESVLFSSARRMHASTIVTGPWFGEFGVLLVRWLPHVRWIRSRHPRAWLIVGGYADEAFLYRDIADEFWAVDPALRNTFKDAETANNYGTLPSLRDDYGVHAHVRRKGFPDRRLTHDAVAGAWLARLRQEHTCEVHVACTLGEGRVHQHLTVSRPGEIRRALDALYRLHSAQRPLVMLLPRRRRHQARERSWPVKVYAAATQALTDELDVNVALLGSPLHEPEPLGVSLVGRTIDLSHHGVEAQLAYWQIAVAATGALSGGLVPAYFTDTKPIFWHRGATLPERGGRPWPHAAESAYSALGVTADWVRIESDTDMPAMVAAVGRTLECR